MRTSSKKRRETRKFTIKDVGEKMGMGMRHCTFGIAHSEMLNTIRVDDVILILLP